MIQKCRRSSSSVLEPLEDMVTCPIDLNFLDDPRLLPCGHAFCCKCLNNYMEKLPSSNHGNSVNSAHGHHNNITNNNNNHNSYTANHSNDLKESGNAFPCPICRALCPIPVTRKADSFPSAFNHKAILEFLKNNHINSFVSRMNNNNNDSNETTGTSTDPMNKTPPSGRKTSIQVSSRMLNYIVDDIASKQRAGRMNALDRAVIMDEVNKLLVNLQPGVDTSSPMSTLNPHHHPLNVNISNSLEKNVNTTHNSSNGNACNGGLSPLTANNNNPTVNTSITSNQSNPRSSTPSTISPTNSIRHLGRFYAAASRIRRITLTSVSSDFVQLDNPSYVLYRDAEGLRIMMERNSKFHVLSKGKDCCIMRPGESYQPIDMQILPPSNSGGGENSSLQRCTLTTNTNRDELVLWRQQLHLDNDLFSLHHSSSSHHHNHHSKHGLNQISSQIIVDNSNPIKIQFLRFYGSLIYLSGIITLNTSNASTEGENGNGDDDIERSEFGILVCCTISDDMHRNTTASTTTTTTTTTTNPSTNGSNNHKDNHESNPQQQHNHQQPTSNPFPIIATSSLFYRDSVGLERQNQPIIFGIDIDHSNGDIYIAQPANAMICRLKCNDLTRIDRTWYLNDPQLSPYFLCYAKNEQSVWATCPTEDKVLILDIEVDSYFHFTPSVSFGIVPGHIIYTSDNRIILLDQSNYDLYWITKIEKAICVQRLTFQIVSHQAKKCQIMAIQPVYNDDMNTSQWAYYSLTSRQLSPTDYNNNMNSNGNHNNNNTNHHNNDENNKSKLFTKSSSSIAASIHKLRGGIVCAHNYGCSVIYPQKLFSRYKFNKMSSCLNLCGKL
uniref:RING-type domain-containing protein n=1 Tax=Trichobilharzia regenti TaxID=157069 RepID=A0AA85IVN5_TRIRE|nr:unnamed protein product [Trichobilharzia regenti]